MTLSIEQIKAIAKSMPLMPKLNSLHLEDTNVTDLGFSLLLKSISIDIQSFKSISFKGNRNSFGEKSYR